MHVFFDERKNHLFSVEVAIYYFRCLSSSFIEMTLLPPANEVWGKVIFSEACVKNSVNRGTGVGIPPPERTPRSRPPRSRPPRSRSPTREQTPPGSRHCAGGTHPTGMHSCCQIKKCDQSEPTVI